MLWIFLVCLVFSWPRKDFCYLYLNPLRHLVVLRWAEHCFFVCWRKTADLTIPKGFAFWCFILFVFQSKIASIFGPHIESKKVINACSTLTVNSRSSWFSTLPLQRMSGAPGLFSPSHILAFSLFPQLLYVTGFRGGSFLDSLPSCQILICKKFADCCSLC